MQKGTYCNWNVLENAGVSDGTQLRSLTLRNNNSKGEVRIYDMYVRVPDRSGATNIVTHTGNCQAKVQKVFCGGQLIILKTLSKREQSDAYIRSADSEQTRSQSKDVQHYNFNGILLDPQ